MKIRTPNSPMTRRTFNAGVAALGATMSTGTVPTLIRAQESASGSVRLNYYRITDEWEAKFAEVTDAFSAANPSIDLTVDIVPGEDYWDKLQIEFAGDQAPDVTIMNMNWLVPGAARGMFVDLKPYLDRDRIDLTRYWYPFDDEWGWKGQYLGGLLYAGGQALFVNKDLLAASDLPFPEPDWTWNDMKEYAKALTVPDNDQWGLFFSSISPPDWGTSFIHGAGGTVLNEDRTRCTLTEPEAREGLQFIADLILNDKVMLGPELVEGQVNPFISGKVGMYFGGTWDEVAVRSVEFDWDFAHMPMHPETGLRSVQRDSNAWSILSTSENQDAAWEVVKYLISEDAQMGLIELGVPVLTSVLESPAYREAHLPQDITVVTSDFSNYGHDLYPTADAAEWWAASAEELYVVWTGEASVEEATQRASDRINEIFANRPPEWNE
jgi:multiple sugar transport system substrate-binding protein